LAIIFWVLFPNFYRLRIRNFSLIIFLVLSSLNVFGTILSGWASNSKYSFLGSIRAIAQTISYEVRFVLIVFFPVFLTKSWNLEVINRRFCVLILFIPLFFIFTRSIIAETNRAPFDFAEGESELVSGFNIEYGGGRFVLLFLAEYANILFISAIAVRLFFYRNNIFFYSLMVLFIRVLFLFSRGAYPRLRYDLLIKLCWKCYLPRSILVLLLILPII
jgi:NADH-ubiquinone oxidoreductase chain 1